jgi:flagellin
LTANGNVFTISGLTGTGNTGSSDYNGLILTLGSGANAYTSAGANSDVLTISNNTLQFQTGANAGNTTSVSFGSVLASNLGTGASGVVNTNFTSLANVTLNTGASDATDAVRVIDQAIQQVSTEAGNLGAFQDYNLQANATNLQAALTNTTAAESTVTDTNFASEIANFSQLQVQEEAGSSVLGIANQLPSTIATLLQKL